MTDAFVMSLLSFAVAVGACLLGIFIYWHLQRIRKPGLAISFYILALGFTIAQLGHIVYGAILAPSIMRTLLGLVVVTVLASYAAAPFANPLRPPQLSYDPDEPDDDFPTERGGRI
ncbi:MAG: hypothetical protein AAGI92_09305 [Pseudomonadota bacterium]